jgi:26S proteasome regulatory subunit T5
VFFLNKLIFLKYCLIKILDIDPQGDEEEGANVDLDSQRKGKCAVIKTSTRQVI